MARYAKRVFHAARRTVCFILLLVSASCTNERTYEVQGRVAGFGDGPSLIVEHEEIRGLMPAMTMPFDVGDASALDTLHAGDAVAFVLHIRGDSTWIDEIRRLPDSAVAEHPAGKRDAQTSQGPDLLEIGDPVPTTSLLTHADTTLDLTQLKGTPVVLSFIYTRCPLPDYCPRITENFVRLQERLREEQLGPIRLLSISFDPEHDTAAVLREYAGRFHADLSMWTFATGDSSDIAALAHRFGVFYRTEGGEIVHNLSTAVIGPDGTIRRIWRGNDWTVEQILSVLLEMKPA